MRASLGTLGGQQPRPLAPGPHPPPPQAYHCSGSDTLLGSANVGASIFILLLIGFVVGFALAWLVFWRRQRKQVLLEVRRTRERRRRRPAQGPPALPTPTPTNECHPPPAPPLPSQLEYRERFAQSKRQELPDVAPMVASAAAPVLVTPPGAKAASRLPATAATLASGPLALGARDSQQLPAKSAPPLPRTGSGNPFAGVEPYNVVRNPTSSLDSSPRLPAGPLARSATGSRVSRTASGGVELGASAGERGSRRCPCCQPAPRAPALCTGLLLHLQLRRSRRPAPVPPQPCALHRAGSGLIPARRPTDEQQQQEAPEGAGPAGLGLAGEAAHARSETVVVNPLAPSSAGGAGVPASDLGAALARVASAQQERQAAAAPPRQPATGDYAAAMARTASGNPFSADKQAQKRVGACRSAWLAHLTRCRGTGDEQGCRRERPL